eukprot:scaffold257115_cov19-Tisochrysis_lutea.AAC.1
MHAGRSKLRRVSTPVWIPPKQSVISVTCCTGNVLCLQQATRKCIGPETCKGVYDLRHLLSRRCFIVATGHKEGRHPLPIVGSTQSSLR